MRRAGLEFLANSPCIHPRKAKKLCKSMELVIFNYVPAISVLIVVNKTIH